MIIDAHAHAAREYSTVESIQKMVEKYDLEKIILCTSPKNNTDLDVNPPKIKKKDGSDSIYILNKMVRFAYRFFMKDKGDGNQYVFELKNKLPQVIIQFLWVNPKKKNHMDALEKNIHDYQPMGIKLHQSWGHFKIDSPGFRKLAEIAGSHKLPIFIHLYSRKEALKLYQFIQNHQDNIFIIGHLIGRDIFNTEGVYLRNVYFDTSSSDRISSEDIQNAINQYGYDHIIFGTDTPYGKIDAQIKKIENINLPENIKEHIYRLNILNILPLEK